MQVIGTQRVQLAREVLNAVNGRFSSNSSYMTLRMSSTASIIV